jgi:hypothetical protein
MAKQVKTEQPDVSMFDYKKLTNDNDGAWDKYQELIRTLDLNKEYEWEQFYAVGVYEKEFNKKTGNSDDVLVGIRLTKGDSPINRPRVALRFINDLNTQTRQGDSNGRYYLLARPLKAEQ